MSFQVSRTVWFGNGYGVEFVIVDPYQITFNVVTEKDPTMVSASNVSQSPDSVIASESLANEAASSDTRSG